MAANAMPPDDGGEAVVMVQSRYLKAIGSRSLTR